MTQTNPNIGWQISSELAVPFHIGVDGSIAKITDPLEIAAQRIRSIVLTSIGERVMRPTYGTTILSVLFAFTDSLPTAELVADIRNGVSTWESNIQINKVDVIPFHTDGTILITINYSVIGIDRPGIVEISSGEVGFQTQG